MNVTIVKIMTFFAIMMEVKLLNLSKAVFSVLLNLFFGGGGVTQSTLCTKATLGTKNFYLLLTDGRCSDVVLCSKN
jgi:hypothetical protein